MDTHDWIIDIAEKNKNCDSLNTTSELRAVRLEDMDGQTGEMMNSAHNFKRGQTGLQGERAQRLPPLIVHKRPWPAPLSASHSYHTVQRIRKKSCDVPDIVITEENNDSEDEEMLHKTSLNAVSQLKHRHVRLPSISECGKLAPPVIDNSYRATYQTRLRRRSSCVRLPNLSVNKMENQENKS